MKPILLGYEVPTGKEVHIQPAHLVVAGITQKSGKTTTLEALIKRSGLKAVVFKTKIGEKGFSEGTLTQPFFKERCDWQYVTALLEASSREKLKFEKSWIIDSCRGARSLAEVKKNIDDRLLNPKTGSLTRSVLTVLQAYLDEILPELQLAPLSNTLNLNEGTNIMDLTRFRLEVQSLIIRSVLEQVLNKEHGVIVVMPEAWKFVPQQRGNPCKQAVEEFIRQGATNQNFLWFDSQDMAGVDKTALKQVSTWILGIQQEINEVRHTLDQLPIPKRSKPPADEIMTLPLGHFFVCTAEFSKKIYALPSWLSEEYAIEIAQGKRAPESASAPQGVAKFNMPAFTPPVATTGAFDAQKYYGKIQGDLAEVRQDFFNRAAQIEGGLQQLAQQINELKAAQTVVDENAIVARVLQKIPAQAPVYAGGGRVEVVAKEAILQGFMREEVDRLLAKTSNLTDFQKRALKFIESLGTGSTKTQVIARLVSESATGGSAYMKFSAELDGLASLNFLRKDASHGRYYPNVSALFRASLEAYNPQPSEIENAINAFLAKLN